MPELPEVEIVTSSLNKLINGRTIRFAELLRDKLAHRETRSTFAEKLENMTVNDVRRRGKHILFELNNDLTLITHLRMSGRFQLFSFERENPKFTHAVFYLENDERLIFSDQRHFGFMQIVRTSNINEVKELRNLAPEPFSEEFSVEYLRATLNSSARRVKEFILDQTKVCGLGNIYAAEALFLSRINPLKPANEVSAIKARRLHGFIREVMAESIEQGSTLNIDPENLERNYYGGGYEDHWRVYDREGEPCIACATNIKRLKHGGRSSYFCPKCQRM
ncbi:MAG: bifunctional DNA-formamidopyrimidine glycosylase/DNA-(apurinic or apyrimidinic site) lyase [Pyrinomonadaceae bacterium]|nr:bifunctional DNA-formamidopyrimidine glycosylase/DNA-(apurinic or apyrimidinic site) lyase [Pyrinomonadaceae bacterium]